MQNKYFDYIECKELILRGILESLEQRKVDLIDLPKTKIGSSEIKGMSLDILPWHNLIQISFCHDEDTFTPRSIPDWKFSNFIVSSDEAYESLSKAVNYVSSFWEGDSDDDGEDLEEYYIERELKSNIIFLAGAEAVLDSKVVDLINDCGIKIWTEHFFIVSNDDDPMNTNYCEVVKINQATKLFFEELEEAKSLE